MTSYVSPDWQRDPKVRRERENTDTQQARFDENLGWRCFGYLSLGFGTFMAIRYRTREWEE